MAFKDTFNKFISYFDTDDVSEIEDIPVSPEFSKRPEVRPSSGQATKPATPVTRPKPRQEEVSRQAESSSFSRERATQQVPTYDAMTQARRPQQSTPASPRQGQASNTQEAIIALRYPRRYEDAPAIVDLLIQNESVLIDFEFMMEAQARRCLDFIDGASKVLYGDLQKVGASMYLLTPAHVSVDVEEVRNHHAGADSNYDFDMKRR